MSGELTEELPSRAISGAEFQEHLDLVCLSLDRGRGELARWLLERLEERRSVGVRAKEFAEPMGSC